MARRPSSRGPIDTYLDSLGLYRLKVPPQEPLFRIVAEQVSYIAVPPRPRPDLVPACLCYPLFCRLSVPFLSGGYLGATVPIAI